MYDNYYKEFINLFHSLSISRNKYNILFDFLKMTSISMENVFLKSKKLEDEFALTRKTYSESEIKKIERMFGLLVLMFETQGEIKDILGNIYEIEHLNENKLGQFFTPFYVAKAMARISLPNKNEINDIIQNNGYISCADPTCGAGVLILATANVLKEEGINFQRDLLAVACDISPICAYMTYIQLSILGIPAIVNCGNALTNEVFFTMKTPFYYLNYYKFRNKRKNIDKDYSKETTKIQYTFNETVKNGNMQISFW